MKTIKFLILLFFAGGLLAGCSKSADPSATSRVSLSMSASTTSGKAIINGRVMTTTISLTDVKVNVRDIKFDFDREGKHHHDSSSMGGNHDGNHHEGDNDNDSTGVGGNDGQGGSDDNDSTEVESNFEQAEHAHDSSFVDNHDPKLMGPFIVDLMNAGSFVDQVIASINLPNAKYEKVSFKLVPSTETGDMNGKSILITGTIGSTPFIFWHHRDARFGARFKDSTALVTNGAAVDLAIHLELDKILSAVNGGVDLSLATDGNQDGTITIDPLNTDGNKHLADAIMNLLVRHTHSEREHHD